MKRRVDLYQFAAAQCMRRRGHYFAPLRVKLKAGAKYGAAQQTRKFGSVDLFASSAYIVFLLFARVHTCQGCELFAQDVYNCVMHRGFMV
jgi:hypothetical protein